MAGAHAAAHLRQYRLHLVAKASRRILSSTVNLDRCSRDLPVNSRGDRYITVTGRTHDSFFIHSRDRRIARLEFRRGRFVANETLVQEPFDEHLLTGVLPG